MDQFIVQQAFSDDLVGFTAYSQIQSRMHYFELVLIILFEFLNQNLAYFRLLIFLQLRWIHAFRMYSNFQMWIVVNEKHLQMILYSMVEPWETIFARYFSFKLEIKCQQHLLEFHNQFHELRPKLM